MPPLPKGGKVLRSKTRGDIVFKSDWYIAFYIPQSNCLKSAICQPPAGGPVVALTVHRTVIHYRDCASLTL